MKRQVKEPTNIPMKENKEEEDIQKLASELYRWSDLFNKVFFKDQPVKVSAISFEKANVKTHGIQIIGRDKSGFFENINIPHLNRPLWDLLATLLHEMCHSWQTLYSSPSKSWFHNKEFQRKMLSFGITVNNKGCHLDIGDPFVSLLKKHGVRFDHNRDPDGMLRIPTKPKGKSKLKKWTCGCTNIRVAIQDFEAKCLKCGKNFELVE